MHELIQERQNNMIEEKDNVILEGSPPSEHLHDDQDTSRPVSEFR